MAGRRACITKAVAVVALLALLFAAGEAEQICNVDKDAVVAQCGQSCLLSGKPSPGCCDALRHANFRCLCDNYWSKLKALSSTYAKCAGDIPSVCNIPEAKCR